MNAKQFTQTLLAGLCALQITGCDSNNNVQPEEQLYQQDVRLMVASDVHVMDPSLLVGGKGSAFEQYLTMDRKLLAESDAIMRSVISSVQQEQPRILLLTGDLTKDGEKASHQRLVSQLKQLTDKGIKVMVIPGNHDINNPNAKQFEGNTVSSVPSVTPAEFAQIYKDCGFGQAIARDEASLSYVAEPIKGLWIVAMDACLYEDNYKTGHPETDGAMRASTRAWVKNQLTEAKKQGKTVIGMLHHGVVEHFVGQEDFFGDYMVNDWKSLAEEWARAGMRVVFTGHFHANDAAQLDVDGRPFYDVETGATVTAPCPYRMLTIRPDKTLAISTRTVQQVDYPLPAGKLFPQYAEESLQDGLGPLSEYTLQQPPLSLSAEQAKQLAPFMVKTLIAHYKGDEKADAQTRGEIAYLKQLNPQLGFIMELLWNDQTPDNTLEIKLQ